jgi:hypothetical protein
MKLKESLSRNDNKYALVNSFLSESTNQDDINFINCIKDFSEKYIRIMISYYVDEKYSPTLKELIDEGRSVLFEYEGTTFCLSAMVDNEVIATELGSLTPTKKHIPLDAKVKRMF